MEEHQEDEPETKSKMWLKLKMMIPMKQRNPYNKDVPQDLEERFGRTIRQPISFEPRMTGGYHEVSHLQHILRWLTGVCCRKSTFRIPRPSNLDMQCKNERKLATSLIQWHSIY